MLESLILLNTVDKVKDFVHLVSGCPFDVDVISSRYVVDGKSIMGIFSLDLARPLTVRLLGQADPQLTEELEKRFPLD